MKATDIQAEINRKRARRAELERDRAAAERKLSAARTQLVEGEATTADVTTAQTEYTTLSEALSALDGQLEQLEAQRVQAEAAETRGAQVGAVVHWARETNAAIAELNTIRREMLDALAPYLERATAEKARLAAARERGITALGALGNVNLFGWALDVTKGDLFSHAEEALKQIERANGINADGLRSGIGRQSVIDQPGKSGLIVNPLYQALAVLEERATAQADHEQAA